MKFSKSITLSLEALTHAEKSSDYHPSFSAYIEHLIRVDEAANKNYYGDNNE